jgi:glycosyltransferase involved in cell wall biosynthesis
MAIKVCHLTSVHPLLDTRIFYKECRSLARQGYEVELIARHDKMETIDGVRVIPLSSFKNRFFRITLSPLKMFWLALKRKAAVYHFHDPELLVTGILLRLWTRAKIVYDIHESYANLMFEKSWIPWPILRRLMAKWFAAFERTASRFMAANVVVLPNWQERYPRSVAIRNYPIIEEAAAKKEKNLFIYVGMIEPVRSGLKMLDIFAHLARKKPDFRLTVVGRFDDREYEAQVLEKIAGNKNISFLGFRPYHEVKELLAKAKFGFVLYSDIKYKENIPVKMFEYLAYRVVPIFSSFKDFKYDIEAEGWGIPVDPTEPEAAARKIMSAIDDKKKLSEIEENIDRYRGKYNWESEKEKLVKLYEDLLSHGSLKEGSLPT